MLSPTLKRTRLRSARPSGGWLCVAILWLALGFGRHGQADVLPLDFNSGNPITPANVADYMGRWIWDHPATEKQTCRFWKKVIVPPGRTVTAATLLITVDNGYRLFLDGREIGRGSDWRTVTQYDLKLVLPSGVHVLAVEGFNDRLEAGVILGLHLRLNDQTTLDIRSDETWRIPSLKDAKWLYRKSAPRDWPAAVVVGEIHQNPWANWPIAVVAEPPIQPLIHHFWDSFWFQSCLLLSLLLAVSGCVWFKVKLTLQSKAQNLLQVERVRIARDIHDDLGSQLTQIVLFGEVAQREHPENSPARNQFNQVCLLARNVSQAMDEIVWAVNSRRDTLRDFVNYVCKHAQIFLGDTPIRCRLDVELNLPEMAFDLPLRRNLFLAVKEALNNAAKYSGADELFLRIHHHAPALVVVVADNGRGFDPAQTTGERNGLTNMSQRMAEIGGTCELHSQPGAGCQVIFTVPLENQPQQAWVQWFRRRKPAELDAPNLPSK